MRFGIWTPLPHTIRLEPVMEQAIAELKAPGGNGIDKSFQFAVEVLRTAEGHGFDITLIAERFLGPDLESWIMSAALAAQTQTIQIMPAVHPGIVTPQVVAKMGATLDRISGGRFAINIVNGWWKDEFNLFSNGAWLDDQDQRYRRMDEFIRVLKGLWSEDTFSHAGAFYRFESGSVPTKARRPPPIYATSRSDIGKDIIAQQCDVWFASYQPGYRRYEENVSAIARDVADMKARSSSYGRQLSCGLNPQVICADTMQEAEAQAEELEAYGRQNRIASIVANALGSGLVGTPNLIAQRIRRYQAVGIDLLLLRFHPMLQGLDTFARKVMPLLH